jgi:hypothetical protein
MKKSELRSLIREVLHEELGKIDEKGFLSSLKRTVADHVCGGTFVKGEDGLKTVATVAEDMNKLQMSTGFNEETRIYRFTLVSGVPKDTVPSKELLSKLRALVQVYEKSSSKREDCTIKCRCYKAASGSDAINYFFEVGLTPNSGYEIMTTGGHDMMFNKTAPKATKIV